MATLKGIDTSVFAKKEELINVVAGGGISIVQTGIEKKISSSIGNATSTESGLMSFIDKNLVDSWDDKRDSLIGHVGESEKHIPVGGITGQVLAKKSLDPYDVEWRNVGGATPAVYRVAGKTPDEFGNVDLEPSDIEAVSQTDLEQGMTGKADKNHTHTEVNGTKAGFMGIDDKKKLDELSDLGITPLGNSGEALVVSADGAGTEWAVVSGVPVGTIIAWGGLTAPAGYLECAGQSLSRTTYGALFTAIGTTWGTTSADNFKLPDFKTSARFLRSRGDGLEVGQTQEDAIRNIWGDMGKVSGIFAGAATNGNGAYSFIWSQNSNDTHLQGYFSLKILSRYISMTQEMIENQELQELRKILDNFDDRYRLIYNDSQKNLNFIRALKLRIKWNKLHNKLDSLFG